MPTEIDFAPALTGLAILRARGQFGVQADRDFRRGDVLCRIDGRLTSRPTRYSVQIGESRHIDLPTGKTIFDLLDSHAWPFLNHSCAPNALLRDQTLIALTDIRRFEAITFDYNANEAELAEPFRCNCGSAHCEGEIGGWRSLDASGRARREGRVARHLLPVT